MATPSLITLRPIPYAELPERSSHPTKLLRAILTEATSLVPHASRAAESTLPISAVTLRTPTYASQPFTWMEQKPRSGNDGLGHTFRISSYSATRVCTTAGVPETEHWFARRSTHPAEHASYDEFTRGLLHGHAENELEYVGSVKGVDKVLSYPAEGNMTADIYEITHRMPMPLKPRVFPILLVTEEKQEEFRVVSVPVTGLEGAAEKHKAHVLARYASVEIVKKLENGETEWSMATASDAGGLLPMMLQKPAIPGTIVKDVGWFIGWVRDGMVRKHARG